MSRNYYVNGSTVRQLEAAPQQQPRRKSEEELQRERRQRSRHNAALRNRQKAMYMSKGYVVFLSVCVAIVAISAVALIQIQSQVTHRMKNVAALESEINNLRADNDAKYKSITTSVDLNQIKDIAINELGMSYASEDQVVYYSVEKNNFLDQYQDIPE
ncbi:MAG: cell division protein FtsL [Agathobacter sp.]|nr:cell division protein FtsL [Agathobacter sp.]